MGENMYKVIIADDEIHICMLLRKLIDWEEMGIEIVGEYTDGDETLKAIYEKKPDIVITDVMMPGISGLDIVKQCNADKINCVFLLISGHAEFEYAHMAIKYNVENYLLKPVDKDELQDNLLQIIGRLQKEEEARENYNEIENKLKKSTEVLHRQFLNNIMTMPGWLNTQNVSSLMQDYDLDYDQDGRFRILVMRCVYKAVFDGEQRRLLVKQMQNYVLKIMERQFGHTEINAVPEGIYVLISYESEKGLLPALRNLFDQICMRFFEYCDMTLGISSPCIGIAHLSEKTCMEAEAASRCYLNSGLNRVYEYSTEGQEYKKIPVEIFIRELIPCIDMVNAARAEELFADLVRRTDDGPVDLDSLFLLEHRIKEELGRGLLQLYQGDFDVSLMEEKLEDIMNHAESRKAMLLRTGKLAAEELRNYSESVFAQQFRYILIAKDYIREHMAENISLADVSQTVYMNPTYFSTLFKRATGQNFSDYLVEVRISRAKELLKDLSISVADVGTRVGYPNSRYFSKVFLKTVGVKPSEYRKLSRL